ncbi:MULTISPECIES: hypothetical protein [unclassified Bacillus (in: firmicutes)]|uniref:hypothetical protein n=1 Tax=unclassified Bacillus (in: firmicutes) TaxID=185979 RepID=UPI0008E53ADF|nr:MULTISPECIES: hypothetical protein [unclassified Bacillus (in: firmicutes)]SFA85360.1 hypothetical protein SAMN02799634_10220 [Bacillus sp. UNCCL13]SFQ83383.1 hypothetical protein SAMN04488577_2140 [Bacillus sp. cl95]
MNTNQAKPLKMIKNVTVIFWLFGMALFLYGFTESGIRQDYTFAVSLSIMVSAILTLGFCVFIQMMEEVSGKNRQVRSQSSFVYKKSQQIV